MLEARSLSTVEGWFLSTVEGWSLSTVEGPNPSNGVGRAPRNPAKRASGKKPVQKSKKHRPNIHGAQRGFTTTSLYGKYQLTVTLNCFECGFSVFHHQSMVHQAQQPLTSIDSETHDQSKCEWSRHSVRNDLLFYIRYTNCQAFRRKNRPDME